MAVPDDIRKVSETLWEIPPSHRPGMRVSARIVADEELIAAMDQGVFDQAAAAATLPGIVGHSWCMPDGHSGYGFPVGGMAAFDPDTGVISPGGIGFDINCGVRLVRTSLSWAEVQPRIGELVDLLARLVPAGVGAHGTLALSPEEFRRVAVQGAKWCIERGFGWPEDLELTENGGRVGDADPDAVSARAVERGLDQVGTLGSGNHYLEVQVSREADRADTDLAGTFGIDIPDQVMVMLHCGSRGFGHQVATDFIQAFAGAMGRYRIGVTDRNLACAPFSSKEGQAYFAAMRCAVNLSYANRQLILHRVREAFAEVFHRDPHELGMRMVYDVSHNTAQLEQHLVDGRTRTLLVHRKGATRALGPGDVRLPERYRTAGQPVIVGGSMETGSWLLAGVPGSRMAFETTVHGSGRRMSRGEAKRRFDGKVLRRDLERRGIAVRAASASSLAEEAGEAYKDIDAVAAVTERAGLSRRVAKLIPVGCIKG
jgi:tRNA-splicing ligase RtcB